MCVCISSPPLSSGEYYRDEVCDGVQESLSSSSLRRKLFLDGRDDMNGGSDTSNPASPERARPTEQRPPLGRGREGAARGGSGGEALSYTLSSPLSCGVAVPTPSTVSRVLPVQLKLIESKCILFGNYCRYA